MEDLITPQDVVVTLSHTGYIKSQPLEDYTAQKRGGRGKQATAMKEEISSRSCSLPIRTTTSCASPNRGRVHWLKVYEVPQAAVFRVASR